METNSSSSFFFRGSGESGAEREASAGNEITKSVVARVRSIHRTFSKKRNRAGEELIRREDTTSEIIYTVLTESRDPGRIYE